MLFVIKPFFVIILYDTILTIVYFKHLFNILLIWILSTSSSFKRIYKPLNSMLQTSSNSISSIKSIEIRGKKRRFDYITRFLAIDSSFNNSTYTYKVSNTRNNDIILNNAPEPNIIWKRTVPRVSFSASSSKTTLRIISSFLPPLETFPL